MFNRDTKQPPSYQPPPQPSVTIPPPPRLTSHGPALAATAPAAHLDLDWYKTPEGQGVLTHLVDQETGHRKIYGTIISY